MSIDNNKLDSIFSFQGPEEGASVFLIGGMHGNEPSGVQVVSRLLKSLEKGELQIKSGSLTLAFGNPKAIQTKTRFVNNGFDLNRLFTKDVHERDEKTYEYRRAKKLARIIEISDIVVDVHSTNKPSIPFISSKVDPAHERVYRWFQHSAILEDPNHVLAGDVASSDEYADYKNKVGVCVESGYIGDETKFKGLRESVYALLVDYGIIDSKISVEKQTNAPIYILERALCLRGSNFRFAPHKGEYNFEPIHKGETLAYQGVDAITAPYNGVIVFPKIKEHWVIGQPVCYIAYPK